MIERKRWRITPTNKDKVASLVAEEIRKVAAIKIVELRDETRTDAQNRLLWPLLTDVATQVLWGHPARYLAPEQWKIGFLMGLEQHEYVPGIYGGAWPLFGYSSSALSKQDFSKLIELIYAWGAENKVRFRTDKDTTMKRIEEEL